MSVSIHVGDCIDRMRQMPDASVHCCVTSPPYWGLRDYGNDGQLGLERTPDEYVAKMVEVFREVRRVLRDDGTLWLNLGDSYNAYNGNAGPNSGFSRGSAADTERPKLASGHALRTKGLKPKDLVGIPWRVAFALQADGWWLRQDIIWHKPNPMPESVTDRCTKAHEYVFLLAKSQKYYYDSEASKEASVDKESHTGRRPRHTRKDHEYQFTPGGKCFSSSRSGLLKGKMNDLGRVYPTRNRRSVWTVTTKPFKGAHFATFPPDLIEPCIKAGCPVGGTVLDPFGGAGTTGLVAQRLDRNAVLCELNPTYAEMAKQRIEKDCPLLSLVSVA